MSFVESTSAGRDMAEVRRVVAHAGSSFAAGMRILPGPRRRAIYAVYALCRSLDDVVDRDAPGCSDADTRARLLDAWSEEVARIFEGRARTAIGAEIARAAERIELPPKEFELILEGMRMDEQTIVAPSAEQLAAYVRRVAGSVGILSMHCFGAWLGRPSERFALSLAVGLQLTNILRDVAGDARMGRLYLPMHVLEAAGIPRDPTTAMDHRNLPVARAALGREARAAFDAAAREIGAHRRVPLLPALLMMGPYERMLHRWEADWTRPPPSRSRWGKVLDGVTVAVRGTR